MQAIKREVVVQEGGRIEVVDPDLPVGARAEVTIRIEPPARRLRLTELAGAGAGVFATAEEVDEFIRREREAWD